MDVVEGEVDEIVLAGGPRLLHLHGQLNGPYSNTWSSERLETNSLLLLSATDDDSVEFVRAREVIAAAESLYFLGFGFHDRSVRRLGDFLDLNFTKGLQVSGTRGGFKPPAWERTRDELFPHGWTDLNGRDSVIEFVRYNQI